MNDSMFQFLMATQRSHWTIFTLAILNATLYITHKITTKPLGISLAFLLFFFGGAFGAGCSSDRTFSSSNLTRCSREDSSGGATGEEAWKWGWGSSWSAASWSAVGVDYEGSISNIIVFRNCIGNCHTNIEGFWLFRKFFFDIFHKTTNPMH